MGVEAVFSSNKKSKRASKVDTLIGQNTQITGDIYFEGGLHIDGRIKGSVIAENDSGSVVSLSDMGYIEGELRVPNIVLNGNVVGDVRADGHIELADKARVRGNVYYRYIEMTRGAEVNGNLVHIEDSAPIPTEADKPLSLEAEIEI
jgi:cytoskeletal protein CcmA (bactofilin family)